MWSCLFNAVFIIHYLLATLHASIRVLHISSIYDHFTLRVYTRNCYTLLLIFDMSAIFIISFQWKCININNRDSASVSLFRIIQWRINYVQIYYVILEIMYNILNFVKINFSCHKISESLKKKLQIMDKLTIFIEFYQTTCLSEWINSF